ncbi:MAG: NADH-quinone oxidoreductase subunit NuoH [Candidatus Riflebacteria bacterium]|nr:NADH-quinone oxidoreductase subunit NuoH [Candidatus Riflebacteria bacterium]
MGVIRIRQNTSYLPLTIFLGICTIGVLLLSLLEKIFGLANSICLRICNTINFPAVLYNIASGFLFGVILLGFVIASTVFLVWLERKVAGHMQVRRGPMYTGGWHGWLQTLIDGFKLIFKEDIIPEGADRFIFILAPYLVFVPAVTVMAAIPFSEKLVPVNLNMGLIYVFGFSSIAAIGVIMGGWSSNNKYSLLGGLRAAAQMVSYEVPRALSVLGVMALAGSFSLVDIVNAQEKIWFIIPQFLAFAVYFIASLAEINRSPFDIPEAESELVAGFHTEYSSLRFSFFFLAEYANMVIACALATVLFLGGWKPLPFFGFIPSIFWFLGKTYFLAFIVIWLRWTLPRFRVDQLMELSWKILIPIAFLNFIFTIMIIPFIR